MSKFVRPLRALTVAAVIPIALMGTACGDDEPQVCSSLEDLKGSVVELRSIDLSGDSATEFEQAVDTVESDLAAVRDAADEELGTEIARFESSVEEVGASIRKIAESGEIDTASGKALAAQVVGAVEAYDALEDAAPDCDL